MYSQLQMENENIKELQPRRRTLHGASMGSESGPLASITEGLSEGEFMHKDLIPTDIRLENSVLSLEGEDKR